MALTPADLVFYGPFTIAFNAGPTYTALKGDSLTFNIETKKGNVVFEDGTESDWEEGRKLNMELLLSEFDASVGGDMDDAEASASFIVTLLNGKVATVGATCRFFVDVDNGKTKITGFKTVAIGSQMSDLVVITTP